MMAVGAPRFVTVCIGPLVPATLQVTDCFLHESNVENNSALDLAQCLVSFISDKLFQSIMGNKPQTFIFTTIKRNNIVNSISVDIV